MTGISNIEGLHGTWNIIWVTVIFIGFFVKMYSNFCVIFSPGCVIYYTGI